MFNVLAPSRLSHASALHPWRTIGLWLAFIGVSLFLMITLLSDALVTETTLTNNPDSVQAEKLLQSRLGESEEMIDEIAIIQSSTLTVDDPAYRSYVETLYQELMFLDDGVVAGGTHFYLTGEESLVSDDRTTTLIPLVMPENAKEQIDQVQAIVDRSAEGSGFTVLLTGEATIEAEVNGIAERDLAIGEGIGISVALVVLAIVIGSVAAAILPIVLAIVAIIVALGATAILGQAVDLPFFVTNMITMMGLAVGIDYSLFIVSRYREERAKGLDKIDAITRSGSTAGRTVFISGITVGLTLLGLLITPDSANQAVGAGALLVVFAAVAASVTLLPALLSLMGDRVNALRMPSIRRNRKNTDDAESGGFWGWTSRSVMKRPVVSLLIAGGLLLAAATSFADLRQGEVGISALPDGLQSKEAFLLLEKEFGFGQDLPAVIVIDGQTDLESVQTAVRDLETAIAADSAFVSTAVETHPESDLTIVRAWLAGYPASQAAMDAVGRLRSDHIPTAFSGVPAEAMVTGKTATFVDIVEVNDTYTPIVFVLVLGLSFLLLMVAFRSLVIPIKAILMNLLSVGATYGLMVLVFQKGYAADQIGFQQVDVIQTGLPLFLFAVLFGLSMDYHVFLISRIRERFLETGDNNDAVAYGLRSTGRLITGAALIMVAVFGGFAMGDLVAMQQFGFGLAIAVLLDATIVRCILVPASMRLLGKWNWYMPDFLHWLPTLHVEQSDKVERAEATA